MEKQVKICVYPSTATKEQVLTTNGIILDNYCVKAQTTDNPYTGEYILDSTFTTEVQDLLEEENILKVLVDYGYEVFRISKPYKNLRYVDVTARQITIAESLTLYLNDVRPTNQTGQGCLNWLMDHAEGVKEITLLSDIDKIGTAYYEDKSLYEALHDSTNSFAEVWGGEILRRGYNITINKRIGTDRNVVIREGKNLQGFDGFTNIDTLVTKARGKGFNGLKGNWIDSKYINNYARIYRKTIDFSDVKVKTESDAEGFATEAEAIAELDNRIRRQYEENEIDKLKATYNINFVQLEKTEEYKNYMHAERVYVGDTLRVYIPKIKVDIKVRAIAKRYDILAQKTIEITLSNVAEKQVVSINTVIENLKEEYKKTGNNSLSSYIDSMMKAGLQGSYVLVRDNEFLALDTKDINTANKVVRINKNGLAFSSTGYYGEYTYGFTIDGKFNASLITTGILRAIQLESLDGSCQINLSNGRVRLAKGLIEGSNSSWNLDTGEIKSSLPDGSEIIISPKDGFYNKFGLSKREYHHLSYQEKIYLPQIESGSGYTRVIVKLPDEFKGKDCKAFVSLGDMLKATVPSTLHAVSDIGAFCGYFEETNEVYVDGILLLYDIIEKSFHNQNQNLGITLTVMA